MAGSGGNPSSRAVGRTDLGVHTSMGQPCVTIGGANSSIPASTSINESHSSPIAPNGAADSCPQCLEFYSSAAGVCCWLLAQ